MSGILLHPNYFQDIEHTPKKRQDHPFRSAQYFLTHQGFSTVVYIENFLTSFFNSKLEFTTGAFIYYFKNGKTL